MMVLHSELTPFTPFFFSLYHSNWLEMTKHVVNRKVSTLELNKYLQSLSIPTTTKSADRVSLLLTAVPQIDLARAAYHCGAHARALKHYEMHLRNAKKCHGLNTPAYESKFDIGGSHQASSHFPRFFSDISCLSLSLFLAYSANDLTLMWWWCR